MGMFGWFLIELMIFSSGKGNTSSCCCQCDDEGVDGTHLLSYEYVYKLLLLCLVY